MISQRFPAIYIYIVGSVDMQQKQNNKTITVTINYKGSKLIII